MTATRLQEIYAELAAATVATGCSFVIGVVTPGTAVRVMMEGSYTSVIDMLSELANVNPEGLKVLRKAEAAGRLKVSLKEEIVMLGNA